MISYLLRLKKLLPTNEIQYDYHHKGNGIFDDCNGEYKFFEFVEPMLRLVNPLFQHYLFLLFFHFQKKYTPTPDRAYIPMNIYIGFTLSPKRYAMIRLRVVLIWGNN